MVLIKMTRFKFIDKALLHKVTHEYQPYDFSLLAIEFLTIKWTDMLISDI